MQANITKLAAKVKGQVETIRKRSEELDRLAQTVREKQTVQLEAGQDKEQRKLRADVKGQNYAEELEQLELKLARTGFVPKVNPFLAFNLQSSGSSSPNWKIT